MKIPRHLAALSLALSAALSMTVGASAYAQTTVYPYASRSAATVDSFGVQQLPALTPGT